MKIQEILDGYTDECRLYDALHAFSVVWSTSNVHVDYHPKRYDNRLPILPEIKNGGIDFDNGMLDVKAFSSSTPPVFKLPFKISNVESFKIGERTSLESWDDIGNAKNVYLSCSSIPDLADLPASVQTIRVVMHVDKPLKNILKLFDGSVNMSYIDISRPPNGRMWLRVFFNNGSTIADTRISANDEVEKVNLDSVFELQDWMMENGFKDWI